MMSMIRNTLTKVAPTATRTISNSTKTNAAISLESSSMPSMNASSNASTGRFKTIAYTVLGSTAVVAGFSHLLKDEVVYWTPNVRK
ncbi:hypothetical protein BGZ95_010140 [Linnemannia exigua]|uniref:Uncharacterized protein n=1 Tax=Linnemannia exigua TaxID=604196 RepID=A0AAD4DBY7_9FUNG|nr:hypothetical protein BGZ95_010140 [Linnemannia exigua]